MCSSDLEAPKLKPETPKVEAPKAEEVPRTFTPTPTPSVQKVPTTPAPSTPPTAEKIGNLSKKFESGGKGPGVVGYDSTGGTSYGVYQIASKVGAMDEFLSFADKVKPEWTKRLRAAGPSNTGSTIAVSLLLINVFIPSTVKFPRICVLPATNKSFSIPTPPET